ncbi:MAG: peptidoglycan recognition family protein [Streptosporangiaceae bacterium]
MKLVRRSQWGARAPRVQPSFLASTRGVKVHYTGDNMDPRLKDDHDRCAPRVRSIQDGHMDGNGWNDIGYSFVVCPHGYVYEARGLHHLPAANGPGLNSGHYAVLGMVGNKGLTVPTDAMLNGIRDAIDHVRAQGDAGKEIKGHRDGYSTDCPGPKLYAWVKAGAPRPAAAAKDEPVKIVINLGATRPAVVAAGERLSLPFDAEYSDGGGIHADGSFPAWSPKVEGWHLVTLDAVVQGQADGEKLKPCISEYERGGGKRLKDVLGEDKIGNGTPIECTLSGLVFLSAARSYRVDLINFGTVPVTVAKANLKIVR